jgi:ribosomal-protein-alanine N-acetyltransferase
VLSALQTHLREPSPTLLAAALDDGALTPATALVSTAEGTGEPVGYLLAVPGEGAVSVAELVVHPAHRREGRASALLAACHADGERVSVTVAPDNEAARALYRDHGFEAVCRLADFFADGPAILYRRD